MSSNPDEDDMIERVDVMRRFDAGLVQLQQHTDRINASLTDREREVVARMTSNARAPDPQREIIYTENDALRDAVEFGRMSKISCVKSHRVCVVFCPYEGWLSFGTNERVLFKCAGTPECREHCNKLCVHAEEVALRQIAAPPLGKRITAQMLHVKLVDGQPVASGPPSCWQCARMMMAQPKISTMWLLHDDGLRGYALADFYMLTMQHCGFPTR